jgi:hypothetical protein
LIFLDVAFAQILQTWEIIYIYIYTVHYLFSTP